MPDKLTITDADREGDQVEITQADIDAAAYYNRVFPELRITEAFARHRQLGFDQARELAAKALDDAIDQGYSAPTDGTECEHGKFYFEECIACYDEHLRAAIRKLGQG